MRKALIPAFLLLLGSTVLGATVLREPIARAAAPISSVFVSNDAAHPVPVRDQSIDANGNVKVHEQGTAAVRDVSSSSAHPVRYVTGFSGSSGSVISDIPAGERLIVTWVDLVMRSDTTVLLRSREVFEPANQVTLAEIPIIDVGLNTWIGSLDTFLPVSSSEGVSINCSYGSGVRVTITGYLVPAS